MAISFASGGGNYLNNTGTFPSGVPLTMSCWFRSDDVTNGVVGMWLLATGANAFRLEFRGDVASDPIQARQNGNSVTAAATTSTGYSANTWHHATAIFTSDSSRTIYLDGGGSATDTTALTPTASPTQLTRTIYGGTPTWDIAHISIWDVALTAAEVGILSKGFASAFVRPSSLKIYIPGHLGTASTISPDLFGRSPISLISTATSVSPRIFYSYQTKANDFIPQFPYSGSGGLTLGGTVDASIVDFNEISSGGIVIGGLSLLHFYTISLGGFIFSGFATGASSVNAVTGSGSLNSPLFIDDFNRSDLGSDWTEESGNWEIQSNKLVASSGSNVIIRTSVAQSNSNYIVQSDFRVSLSDDIAGLVARFTSTSLYYALVLDPANDLLSIMLENTGSSTLASSNVTINANTDYVLKFSLNSNKLRGDIYNSSNVLLGSVLTVDNTITSPGSTGVFFTAGEELDGLLPMRLPEGIGG